MSKKIICTRCSGKGYVDKKDIKRLKKLDIWEEGDCKFCKGKGTITEKFASKHNLDSNKTDYVGMANFFELTEEEKNERFSQALERTGGEIN